MVKKYNIDQIDITKGNISIFILYNLNGEWKGGIKFEGKNFTKKEEENLYCITIDESSSLTDFKELLQKLFKSSKVIKFIDTNFAQSQMDIITELMLQADQEVIADTIELYSTSQYYNEEVLSFFKKLAEIIKMVNKVHIKLYNENIIEDQSLAVVVKNVIESYSCNSSVSSVEIKVPDKKIEEVVKKLCHETNKCKTSVFEWQKVGGEYIGKQRIARLIDNNVYTDFPSQSYCLDVTLGEIGRPATHHNNLKRELEVGR